MDKSFIDIKRKELKEESVVSRIEHNNEFTISLNEGEAISQGKRCMDCGVPFCHNACPLGNYIPEFNTAVSKKLWEKAYNSLSQTNPFPEFTGKICPAPCENACVSSINETPITIEYLERKIAEKAYDKGWIKPIEPKIKNPQKIAIVGSGPAGLSACHFLTEAGFSVEVYERQDRLGGLLMYGIPNYKLEKKYIEKRISILKDSGVIFHTNINIGEDITLEELSNGFDAILLTIGATKPRDLPAKGRDLNGIYFADPFLKSHTKFVLGDTKEPEINVHGKNVIIIGGGDTGSDCLGTSIRQKAKSVVQFEIAKKPPEIGKYPKADERPQVSLWPDWTYMYRKSSSHQEGGESFYAVQTKGFESDSKGQLTGLTTEELSWEALRPYTRAKFTPIPKSEKTWECDIVLLAIGYISSDNNIFKEGYSDIKFKQNGLIWTDQNYQTSKKKIFSAGDMRKGQSLVVWAIQEGREAAFAIEKFLYSEANKS